jgi:hypothetical protein
LWKLASFLVRVRAVTRMLSVAAKRSGAAFWKCLEVAREQVEVLVTSGSFGLSLPR